LTLAWSLAMIGRGVTSVATVAVIRFASSARRAVAVELPTLNPAGCRVPAGNAERIEAVELFDGER